MGTVSRLTSKRNARRAAPVTRGTLIIIGGHEDKVGDRVILSEVARHARRHGVLVATIASGDGDAAWREYREVFSDLGVRDIERLELDGRADAQDDPRWRLLRRRRVVFFTGGDQLRITARFGGTAICERVREIYRMGGVIAGTSSGASVMSGTMLISGPGDESHRVRDNLHMAPGLGLIPEVLIDQHFAERGRMGRLIGGVAHNPRLLGIGIDEDTAIVVERHASFRVIGSGAVYVVDGRAAYDSNISEAETGRVLSVFGLVVHVLSAGNRFDLAHRAALAA
jgi:cyanophycinase